MIAGGSVRFDCDECSKEFEVTYEPKARGFSEAQLAEFPKVAVKFCPCCGEPVTTDDDNEPEEPVTDETEAVQQAAEAGAKEVAGPKTKPGKAQKGKPKGRGKK